MTAFDSPWLVLAAPAVGLAIAALAWWARVTRVQRAERWSSELGASARRVGRLTPAALGVAAFATALGLAGPRWGRRTVTTESKALDLVLVVDISRSMLAEDVEPSRLGRAQREAKRLVHDLEGDRIGLIAFAGQSFILSPLTIDAGALQILIDALDPDMASAGGSELGAALRQGHDLLLGGSEVADRVLVVLTDGEAHDSLSDVLAAAARLRRDGIRLVIVGEGGIRPTTIPVRTPEGAFVEYQRLPEGGLVQTWRHDDILTQVADEAHGALVAASLSDQAGAVRELVAAYKRSPQATTTASDRPLQAWVPALLAVLVLLAHTFTRRTAALAVLVVSVGLPAAARAQFGRNPGDEAWKSGAFRVAAQRYLEQVRRGIGGDTAWFNLGTAALAVGDTQLAGRSLERAAGSLDPDIRFRALFNAGLMDLRLAQADSAKREQYLAEARDRYREALLLRPDDADAKWNLELAVRRARSGGGGGGAPRSGGGGRGGAPAAPPPAARESGLTHAQAEQILNSIANEERQVRQSLSRRRSATRESGRDRNW